MEVKLRKSTRLSTGQKSAKAHVNEGNQLFYPKGENSNKLNLGENKTITVSRYEVRYKYKAK